MPDHMPVPLITNIQKLQNKKAVFVGDVENLRFRPRPNAGSIQLCKFNTRYRETVTDPKTAWAVYTARVAPQPLQIALRNCEFSVWEIVAYNIFTGDMHTNADPFIVQKITEIFNDHENGSVDFLLLGTGDYGLTKNVINTIETATMRKPNIITISKAENMSRMLYGLVDSGKLFDALVFGRDMYKFQR